jgi:hypothetical protein
MNTQSALPGILAIWNDHEDSVAEVYEQWYLAEHLPERLAVPGFLSARRYEANTGTPRYFTSYDVESLEVLSSADYLAKLAAPSPLTRHVMANFRNMMRTVCFPAYRSQGSALGGCVVAACIEPPVRIDDAGLLEAAARCERDPRVLGVQVWRAAQDPAHAVTSEAKLRPGGDRRIEAALVVDVMREQDGRARVESIRAALLQSVVRESATESPPMHVNVYRLLGIWRAPALAAAPATR